MTATLIDIFEPIPDCPHFSMLEFTRTENRKYLELNRQVPIALLGRRNELAMMMEEVRALWNFPVFVHSAYRCLGLNTAIGGSKTSQHMKFEACDFHVSGVSLATAFTRIASSSIPFGQLILEGVDPFNGQSSWIHISLGFPFRAEPDCGQVLYFSSRTGKYTHV